MYLHQPASGNGSLLKLAHSLHNSGGMANIFGLAKVGEKVVVVAERRDELALLQRAEQMLKASLEEF